MSEADFIHISSAVVSVLPARLDHVAASLASFPDIEIFHRTETKIVIVLETETNGLLGGRLAEIAGWPGVLSANMVFECVERRAGIGD